MSGLLHLRATRNGTGTAEGLATFNLPVRELRWSHRDLGPPPFRSQLLVLLRFLVLGCGHILCHDLPIFVDSFWVNPIDPALI